jgi:hypothetical protein
VQNVVKALVLATDKRRSAMICVYLRLRLNASKTRMDFFPKHREQKPLHGCLRGSLSGKGQDFLMLRFPPQGVISELRRTNCPTGQMELEQVAPAAVADSRSQADALFIERLSAATPLPLKSW